MTGDTNMASKNYRDLVAWQRAMDFVTHVYEATAGFPADERFALTSQLRRSATSVPSNIAEGEGRFTKADFKRFLAIAHGSLREAETQLLIAVRLCYLPQSSADTSLDLASEVGRLIRGLAKSLDA
jgi:four helix bundle protein